eukprot:NODE_197_length_13258_cov_0.852344.p5 type:complete len:344 gc:universal NODE_197_length_13258_cov_0.852344:938-1969(+)
MIKPFLITELIPALSEFYIYVEATGASSQFYDKFNIRYNISRVFEKSYQYQQHRQTFQSLSQQESFIKFVNLLMNDTTYLLDEGFSKLLTIKECEIEIDSSDFQTKPKEYRSEKKSTLALAERHASSLISLANETTNSLSYLTKDIVDPFVTTQIVDRLAAMLNYNLELLVGPKCGGLKVKDPRKYSFEPKLLVAKLVDVIIHLMNRQEFLLAMANDYRSFRATTFQRVAGVLKKTGVRSSQVVDSLFMLVNKVEDIRRDLEADNEEEDAPDEFMDNLMFFVMKDPVILPTSKNIVDRSTIVTHLLSDAHDPFNRQPLKIEDVIPDDNLRKKIEQWRRDRKNK